MPYTTPGELKTRLQKTLDVLSSELRSLRLGRASSELVEHIVVEAYDTEMPLLQAASVQIPQPNQLVIQPWDAHLVGAIEKAIRQSDLQLSPVVEGEIIRITLPPLTEERRKELVKLVARHAEEARIAMRNVREEMMDGLDRAEKSKELSEDEKFRKREEAQKIVNEYNGKIQEMVAKKEREITE
jgi:ribosome recycling factor